MDNLVQLKIDLCNVINSSELPFSAKYFVVKDVMGEVQAAYNQYLASCQQNAENEEEQVEENQ